MGDETYAILLPKHPTEAPNREEEWVAALCSGGFSDVRIIAGNRGREYEKPVSVFMWKAEQLRELARLFVLFKGEYSENVSLIVAMDACPFMIAAIRSIRVAAERTDIRFIAVVEREEESQGDPGMTRIGSVEELRDALKV